MKLNIYELSADEFEGEEWWRGLTMKQAAFVLEYLKDFNGAKAARRAGYGGKRESHWQIGWCNLKKEKILRALKLAVKELGLGPAALGMRLRRDQQANGVEFYYFDPLDSAPEEEDDGWVRGMQADHERQQAEKEKEKTPQPPRKDPFLEDLQRETHYREINGEVYIWHNGQWVR